MIMAKKKNISKSKRRFVSSDTKKKLFKHIMFTMMILLLYRIGSVVPVPGIDMTVMKAIFNGSSVFAIQNMIGGGSMERMSLFALGVSPYITASIIVELLSMDVIPALSEWRKSGPKGRNKLSTVTRYLGLALAVVQAVSIVYGFDKNYGIMTDTSVAGHLFVIMALVAGTEFRCWLGDQITEKGIGNGLSMIIGAGIVSGLPNQFTEAFSTLTSNASTAFIGGVRFALYCIVYLVLILAVAIVENSERRIPISYSGRTNVMGGNQMSYLPLKINSASVIPVIFASSVLTAPLIILSFFNASAYEKLSAVLSMQKPLGLTIYAVLTFLFTFFYTDLQVDPDEIADNLKTSNAFIPGIRPGSDTYEYLHKVLTRITVFGATGLTLLAVVPYLLPMLIKSMPSSLGLGGTSVILIVGISLETIKMMKTSAMSEKYKYSSFMGQTVDDWYKATVA